MKTRDSKLANGPTAARSVLECGNPLPLSIRTKTGDTGAMSRACRGLTCQGSALSGGTNRVLCVDSVSQECRWTFRSTGESARGSAVLLAVLLLSAVCTYAQNFSLDWFTIDGGGGTSIGGNFSLSGTIGQPDASAQPMTGGGFSLSGGFWSLFAVQTPDAPLLAIRLISASAAQVSWPSPSAGFVLQENLDLNSTNWVNAPQAISDSGANRFITVNPANGRRFYRLFKP
jgi:hypothetical protein